MGINKYVRTSILCSILSWFCLVLPPVLMAETDVTDKVDVQASRMFFNRRTMVNTLDVTVVNISQDQLLAPVKVVIESLSGPDVNIVGPDGVTPDGKPYFLYGGLEPGASSQTKRWIFNNPLRQRVNYDLIVLDATPAAIAVTGKAVAGLPVVGTINIKDSSDPPRTSFFPINRDGSYSLSITEEWTPPFMMYADGWVNNRQLRLLSCFDLEEGQREVNVNTTPATTAIIEAAEGIDASQIDPLTQPVPDIGRVGEVEAKVRQALTHIFDVIGIPPNFNLFQTPIGQVGSPADAMFDVMDISADDTGNIVVANAADPTQSEVIDPDAPGTVIPEDSPLATGIVKTEDALDQIIAILEKEWAMWEDPSSWPDLAKLEAELKPNLAQGFLGSGYDRDELIAHWAADGETDKYASTLVGCSIYRPMKTQYYGSQPVEEMPDPYEEGLWVHVSINYSGKTMVYPAAFVNVGNNIWKSYGNRRPFRRSERGRPRARQIKYPAGAVTYIQGLAFWHNDVGNKALSKGITRLAIFNPSFAPETIDGLETNCVRMERRAGGLDARYRLYGVPHYWDNDHLYQLSKEEGDRLVDLDELKSQETIEFVFIGLDDNLNPVNTWIFTIPEAPQPLSEIMASPDQYFAAIDRENISFTPYDDTDPDNPDVFPGEGGFFSWTFPANPGLFPSWGALYWEDSDWKAKEYEISNPAWYAPGDFSAWTSDVFAPGPNAIAPRWGQFWITMRDVNKRHYQAYKRWDPWSEDVVGFEGGALAIDMVHEWTPDNLSNQLRNRIQIIDKTVNRFEAKVKVLGGSFVDAEPDQSWDVHSETDFQLAFRPDQSAAQNLSTGWTEVSVRIRVERDNTRRISAYIWQANDNDWDTKWETWPGEIKPGETETKFPGNFPNGMTLQETADTAVYHTLAVALDQAAGKIIVEFDGQSSAINISDIPDFNPEDFYRARIRTRIRNINEPGDSGSIQVRYDDVMVNGTLYDDFNDGFGVNNWYIFSRE